MLNEEKAPKSLVSVSFTLLDNKSISDHDANVALKVCFIF